MSLYAPALAALEARRTADMTVRADRSATRPVLAESPSSPQRRTKTQRKRQSTAPQPVDTTTPSGRPLPY